MKKYQTFMFIHFIFLITDTSCTVKELVLYHLENNLFSKRAELIELYCFYKCCRCDLMPISPIQNTLYECKKDEGTIYRVYCPKCIRNVELFDNKNEICHFKFEMEFKKLHLSLCNEYSFNDYCYFFYRIFNKYSCNRNPSYKSKAYYYLKFSWDNKTIENKVLYKIDYNLFYFFPYSDTIGPKIHIERENREIILREEIFRYNILRHSDILYLKNSKRISFDHIGLQTKGNSCYIASGLQLLKLAIDPNICNHFLENEECKRNGFIYELIICIQKLHLKKVLPVELLSFCREYNIIYLMEENKQVNDVIKSEEFVDKMSLLISQIELLIEFLTKDLFTRKFLENFIFLYHQHSLPDFKFSTLIYKYHGDYDKKKEMELIVKSFEKETACLKKYLDNILNQKDTKNQSNINDITPLNSSGIANNEAANSNIGVSNICSKENNADVPKPSPKKSKLDLESISKLEPILKRGIRTFLKLNDPGETQQTKHKKKGRYVVLLTARHTAIFLSTTFKKIMNLNVFTEYENLFCIVCTPKSTQETKTNALYIPVININISFDNKEELEKQIKDYINDLIRFNGLVQDEISIIYPRYIYINLNIDDLKNNLHGKYEAKKTLLIDTFVYQKIGSVNFHGWKKGIFHYSNEFEGIVVDGQKVYYGSNICDETIVCYRMMIGRG